MPAFLLISEVTQDVFPENLTWKLHADAMVQINQDIGYQKQKVNNFQVFGDEENKMFVF